MMSERRLLAEAKQLDICALEQIYDSYSPRLYRYAVRLLGNASAAEECVAETFCRFLEALQLGKGPRDYLQAYLYRMLHNLVVDHFRYQPPEFPVLQDCPDAENTEESASRKIRQKQVREALLQLTTDQQKVIALKYLEGWENEEIARMLNKPTGAVKSLQHRALARLQTLLLHDEVKHEG
jgi:RNA polymerase sigma-70 factor (ECF subfamily)